MNAPKRISDFPANDAPGAHEVRQQLARILAGAAFRDSLRLTRFLAFIVEATLAGHSERIKAYTVAVEALSRNSDFDPQTNPIVRVEAGRLRSALARYYAEAGRNDPLAIELPRGAYVPVFRRRRTERASSKDAVTHQAGQQPQFERSAQTGGRCHQGLAHSLSEFQQILEIHRQQVAEMTAEIMSARQTLKSSWALLEAAGSYTVLLPTAPQSPPHEIAPEEGRKEQSDCETIPPSWARRSRGRRARGGSAST